ncbi:glycerophosphodiester phosphodiesterase family protein [Streptomyces kunmingensis]|uniref:Glycerophosphodiester phosphodiesterase family protein n=1 Tax=Streptomyces kunmingensis TaxID=68225 RepID=A0ABU6CAD2_9ACTN|nr:glycerophosphodiester phosphodiesterase family protein [Streptomyces kunmingensis]MEB3961676.1 glycerophosphodiester phosphodiesterase family protein [Streptomyces kunmingensis]
MYVRAAAALASVTGSVVIGVLVLPTAAQAASWHDRPVVVAHRGASAYAPENTLEAVDEADDLGTTWVENDVQRTKDGALVIIHDTTLNRTTNVEELFPDRAPWNVRDFTAAEIAKLDAGSWKGAEFAGERVPTLHQYLKRVDRNHQKLLMEIKSPELYPGIEDQILSQLRKDGWLRYEHVKHRLVVQSFSADSMRTMHERRPQIKTGFLGTPAVADLPAYAKFVDQINPSHTTVSADYVSAVHALKGPHRKQLEVYTWTVNDAVTAQRVAGFGVDGIITNNPDVVSEAVDD